MFKAKLDSIRYLGTLPDLFLMENGERVKTKADWNKRREEIYRLAVDFQYGCLPPEPEFLEIDTLFTSATLSTYKIITGKREKPISFSMQIVFPKEKKEKYPIVIDGDGCFRYMYTDAFMKPFQDGGIAFVRFNRTELAYDVRKEHTEGLYSVYPGMNFTSLAAWAWGYHRCLDAVLKLGIADEKLIAYTGHSRGAKTALLAGATDERATIVNPNAACSGAGACYRVHTETLCEDGVVRPSSTLEKMALFPDWFTEELLSYAGREDELPMDCHFIKALVAPRCLIITEAVSDAWSNPAGVHITQRAAMEAYKFLHAEDKLLLHYRDGFHSHDAQDTKILANVIGYMAGKEALDENIGVSPYEDLEKCYDWKCPEEE
ncbi:MAG: hypothetical protein IJC48_01425 [Clostridia bacterium]|nr:hypothetical protein [Clostridia bacterium]